MRHNPRARLAAIVAVTAVLGFAPGAGAESYQRISGEGSSWAAGAIEAMRVNVKQFGITVDYNPSGSTAGRKNFLNGTVDFAASDIPFQFKPEDGSAPENPAPGSYAYMPVTAGGTSFMYNLKINGQRVTNLRLSGENVAKIFTGTLTNWDDPPLQTDNPGLVLPHRKIVPVVRSDGSGSTGQFTRWLIHEQADLWNEYCKQSGRAPACGQTSFYPTIPGMIAQSGDLGVAGYVAQSFAEGAIGYVNYSYSLGARFPVAKVLNRSGYYTEPTPENVAVSLLKAKINTDESSDNYLTQNLNEVYTDPDQRSYQLSSYSYLILPTTVQGQFNTAKGKTLGAFSYYAMCQAQEQSASLGYSPMPINLVEASFEQIRKIPGVVVQDIDIKTCKNPTFSPDGTNVLAQNAKMPEECDKQGPTQCAAGTGGVKGVATPVNTGGGGGAAPAPASTPGPAGTAPAAANGASPRSGVVVAGKAGGGAGGPVGTPVGQAPTASAPCDADTGSCPPVAGVDGSTAANGGTGGDQALASSTVLRASSGWSGTQTLMVLVLCLVLAVVLAPAAVWRSLADKERSS